jgi:hypothetical protein
MVSGSVAIFVDLIAGSERKWRTASSSGLCLYLAVPAVIVGNTCRSPPVESECEPRTPSDSADSTISGR